MGGPGAPCARLRTKKFQHGDDREVLRGPYQDPPERGYNEREANRPASLIVRSIPLAILFIEIDDIIDS